MIVCYKPGSVVLDSFEAVYLGACTQIAQNDRPDVGPISANVGHDIGLMSEIISGRYRQMSADIGPTPCLHVGSMSARCRQRYQADIWPI